MQEITPRLVRIARKALLRLCPVQEAHDCDRFIAQMQREVDATVRIAHILGVDDIALIDEVFAAEERQIEIWQAARDGQ